MYRPHPPTSHPRNQSSWRNHDRDRAPARYAKTGMWTSGRHVDMRPHKENCACGRIVSMAVHTPSETPAKLRVWTCGPCGLPKGSGGGIHTPPRRPPLGGPAVTHARSKRPVAIDPASDPMAPPEYAIRAILDGLDEVALAMERTWGVGRLRLLVSDLLRAKFDAQKDKLD